MKEKMDKFDFIRRIYAHQAPLREERHKPERERGRENVCFT